MIESFLVGVASSIVASFLFLWIVAPRRNVRFLKVLSSLFSLLRSGISCFYTSRAELQRRLGNVGEYVSACKRELMYVGYQLSHSLENDRLFETLRMKVDTGNFNVTIVLLDPRSSLVPFYAKQNNLTVEYVLAKSRESIGKFLELKDHVNPRYRKNVALRVHEFPLTASCFIFDPDAENGSILLDHKYSFMPRVFSYGFEVSNVKGEFFQNLLNSFRAVVETGEEITAQI